MTSEPERRSGLRLAVVIARRGAASRRSADLLIREGRVAVDGATVDNPATRVPPEAAITIDGEPLPPEAQPLRYFALNKPPGVLSTAKDERGRRTVVDFLPPGAGRCVPVGRLDRDSEGLILLTNDGPLITRLLHPAAEVPRTYLVEVRGPVSDEALDQIFEGVPAEDGLLRAKPRRSRRPSRTLAGGASSSWLSLTLHTGRNREVRRLLGAVGCPVISLKRTRFGPVLLRDLPVGGIRALDLRELRLLRRAARNP